MDNGLIDKLITNCRHSDEAVNVRLKQYLLNNCDRYYWHRNTKSFCNYTLNEVIVFLNYIYRDEQAELSWGPDEGADEVDMAECGVW